MTNLVEMAKAEYDSLTKQLSDKEKEIAEIKAQLHPLTIYLKELGVIEKETRKKN